MRTAYEIISDHLGGNLNISTLTIKAWEEIINVARKEAIIKCAERAEAIEGWNTGFSGNAASVDKQSILSLINELK